MNKKQDSFSTFDDGLLFRFPIGEYEHLSYYCRTTTPEMDTCNVKLFKFGNSLTIEEEKKKREWAPPIS